MIVLHSGFTAALVEKARVCVAMGDWEAAMESVQRVLVEDE